MFLREVLLKNLKFHTFSVCESKELNLLKDPLKILNVITNNWASSLSRWKWFSSPSPSEQSDWLCVF